MFGETTISYVKIRNHPIETTIYKWLFGVPDIYIYIYRAYLDRGKKCQARIFHRATRSPWAAGHVLPWQGDRCWNTIRETQPGFGI